MDKKLSKCVIVKGRHLLKQLGIDFQEVSIERMEPVKMMSVIKKEKENNSK